MGSRLIERRINGKPLNRETDKRDIRLPDEALETNSYLIV